MVHMRHRQKEVLCLFTRSFHSLYYNSISQSGRKEVSKEKKEHDGARNAGEGDTKRI